jgi:hypothetical protein
MVNVRNPHLPGVSSTVRLAPGIALHIDVDAEPSRAMLVLLRAGKAHLNQHALTILELCDGSRSRDRLIVDAMLHSAGALKAADVMGFLDAAESRGWIIEGAPGEDEPFNDCV